MVRLNDIRTHLRNAYQRRKARGVIARYPADTIHVLHIRKCAGTTLRSLFQSASGLPPILFHEHAVTLRDIPVGHKVIYSIRNIEDRFVSGFLCRQRMGKPTYNFPHVREERWAFSRFHSPEALASAIGQQRLKGAVQRAMRGIEHLRYDLRYWLHTPDYLKARRPDILGVLRQESLTEDLIELRSRIPNLPDVGGSGNQPSSPSEYVFLHRNPEQHAPLSAPLAHNVRVWYAQELPLFEESLRIRQSLRDEGERRS